ncbi:protein export cytoplasm chaperone protein [alpha proteobacterium U9-1i]|nr:protein export cytoplasm chaperone protein [alpha proteobacterium U9-1i]
MSMQSPEGGPPPADSPHLRVIAQYVKELSFRNPMAATSARAADAQPTIDMGVEVKSRPIGDAGDAYEVDLHISVDAKRDDQAMFSVDLTYSGLFQFMNVQQSDVEPLLWIECPRLLFPFSRQILAEITREGGYPPLLINPIDFTPLYWAELREREAKGAPVDFQQPNPFGEPR